MKGQRDTMAFAHCSLPLPLRTSHIVYKERAPRGINYPTRTGHAHHPFSAVCLSIVG